MQEAKTHLSRLLRRVEAGEEVVIRRGQERVAMLVPAPRSEAVRTIWADIEGELGPEFDEPLEEFAAYR